MGLYRDETGRMLEVDDAFANARGYQPVHPAEIEELNAARGIEARGTERGALSAINAALTGIESGLTLGASDVLLGEALPPFERERLQAELEAHPYLRIGGEVAGMVGGALMTGGAATPTGYLSSVTSRAVESGLERGGALGTAKALGAMGTEGAIQSAGQYIGHSSIEDKEVTAEGLSGALGTGFKFGAIGGGAALGVAKGAIAARRMYSRVMDGRRAADAAKLAWSTASEEALQADTISAQVAEEKLNTIRKAKIEAQRYRNETRAMTEEERIRASGMPEQAGPAGETYVAQTSSVRPEDIGPAPLIEVGEQPKGAATAVFAKAEEVRPSEMASGPPTKAAPRPQAVEPAGTKLEAQLLGTKAQLEEGVPFREIRPEEGLPEIRRKATSDLLGSAVANEEDRLIKAVEEFHDARIDMERIVKSEFAEPQATVAASPGKREAVEILDTAHEEALLYARRAAEPREAGRAVIEADEFEKLLERLAVPRIIEKGQPLSREELRALDAEQWAQELMGDVAKIERYEKASAKLADELGDQAHPTSVLKAKALRDAEREVERKVTDRTARAVDDAETFGPEHKTPKDRIKYAREQQLDAQRKLDELGVQEKEAGMAHKEARSKMREGEKAKKAALREEAQAAAQTGRLGAQDVGGIWEITDIPGMPKPSDLPFIGPLLGAYLKFRTLSRAMGRMMGKVPATGNSKVAALAAQTRDRIARAVDRSLGILERGGKYSVRIAPAAAGILSHRLYDDGQPDAKKGASVQALAAVRIRELAAYVHTPGAIENDVRQQLLDVADPDLIAAAEKHRRQIMEYLLRNAPKGPEQGLLNQINWEPSGAEAMAFARRYDAVSDPAGVWERVAQENAMLSLEAAEALRENYPRLFGQAQQRLLEHAAEAKLKVPYRQRIQLSLLYKVPLDAALDPDNLKITQSVYERKVMNPQPGMPATPPVPSTAGPVQISQAFTNAADRR